MKKTCIIEGTYITEYDVCCYVTENFYMGRPDKEYLGTGYIYQVNGVVQEPIGDLRRLRKFYRNIPKGKLEDQIEFGLQTRYHTMYSDVEEQTRENHFMHIGKKVMEHLKFYGSCEMRYDEYIRDVPSDELDFLSDLKMKEMRSTVTLRPLGSDKLLKNAEEKVKELEIQLSFYQKQVKSRGEMLRAIRKIINED